MIGNFEVVRVKRREIEAVQNLECRLAGDLGHPCLEMVQDLQDLAESDPVAIVPR